MTDRVEIRVARHDKPVVRFSEFVQKTSKNYEACVSQLNRKNSLDCLKKCENSGAFIFKGGCFFYLQKLNK